MNLIIHTFTFTRPAWLHWSVKWVLSKQKGSRFIPYPRFMTRYDTALLYFEWFVNVPLMRTPKVFLLQWGQGFHTSPGWNCAIHLHFQMIGKYPILGHIIFYTVSRTSISVIHARMLDRWAVSYHTIFSSVQFLSLVKSFEESDLCVTKKVLFNPVTLCTMSLVDKLRVAQAALVLKCSELMRSVNSIIVEDLSRAFGHLQLGNPTSLTNVFTLFSYFWA